MSGVKIPKGLPGSPEYKSPRAVPFAGPVKVGEDGLPSDATAKVPTKKEAEKAAKLEALNAKEYGQPFVEAGEEFDPFGVSADDAVEAADIPEYTATPQARVPMSASPQPQERRFQPVEAQHIAPPPNKVTDYMSQRTSITLELTDTMIMVKVIDVIETSFSVTLLLPTQGDGFTFIPKPGSSVTIHNRSKQIPCYFPGTSFEVDALGILGLSFVKAEPQSGGTI